MDGSSKVRGIIHIGQGSTFFSQGGQAEHARILMFTYSYIFYINTIGGLPLNTYAPRGRGGGVKTPIHFHCTLHAKSRVGSPKRL